MARNPFKGLVNFVRHLRHAPPPPDPRRGYSPDTREIKDAARAAFPIGKPSFGGMSSGKGTTDEMVGKAIADSHKTHRR